MFLLRCGLTSKQNLDSCEAYSTHRYHLQY